MKIRHLTSLLGGTLLLTQCGPESMLNPTQEVTVQEITPVTKAEAAFVNNPSGARVDYKDNFGENTYRLKQTHIYQYAFISHNRKDSTTRTGIWMYKKTGAKTGQLIFDGNDIWNLRFVSKNRATAKNEGDARTYTFEFEWE